MTGRFAGAATTLVQRLPGTVPITHRKRGGYVDVDHRSRPGPGQPTPTGRHWHNRSEQTFRRISREESYHGRERKHRALSARQRRGYQRHHLVAGVGSAWGATQVQVPVNQLRQAQMPAQRGWQDQPSIGHQAVVVEGDLDAVGVVIWWSSGSIFWVLLVSGWIPLSKSIIPDAQEHFLTPSPRRHTHLFGGLGLRKSTA